MSSIKRVGLDLASYYIEFVLSSLVQNPEILKASKGPYIICTYIIHIYIFIDYIYIYIYIVCM